MPFLPLFDRNPRILIAQPWVTYGLIVICTLVYFHQSGLQGRGGQEFIYSFGVIPATLFDGKQLPDWLYLVPPYATLVTSLFLHGGIMHLLGNMLYLWVFGDNVEDAMGHWRFLAFYLLCGIAAALAQGVVDPDSQVPIIGASGAISGVLGAALILHPRARILVPIIIFPVFLPAWSLLIVWFGFQIVSAIAEGIGSQEGGVAWYAHIAGFVAGVALVFVFKRRAVPIFGGDRHPRGIVLRPAAPRESPGQRRWGRRKAKRSEESAEEPRRGPWGR